MNPSSSLQKYAPVILRAGLGLVMLWFGSQQLMHPEQWVSFLPSWIGALPVSSATFVLLNGWFEIAFGLLLLSGFYVRFAAGLLALHLFGIAFTIGYDAVGVRDFGLAMALLSLAFQGGGAWSLDGYFG